MRQVTLHIMSVPRERSECFTPWYFHACLHFIGIVPLNPWTTSCGLARLWILAELLQNLMPGDDVDSVGELMMTNITRR